MVWDQDEDRPFSEKRIDSRIGIQLVIYAMYINKLKVQILALLPAKLLLEASPMPHRLYPSHTMYYNGAKKLLCGNVRNFSMTKNGCAHRVQHTRISLGPNFGASSSLIFKDF